ncbi:MAG: dihydroxy-acid dehydratase, partial [Desulfobacterales bacterium]
MKSDIVKKGIERAPHRSLFKAMGYTDAEIRRPMIGIANSANTIIPGHIHLDKIVEAVKAGVYMEGGTPIDFGVIGICDGIAMNHEGMKYSLASRELIADSIEVMATAHAFDAMVMVTNCDK